MVDEFVIGKKYKLVDDCHHYGTTSTKENPIILKCIKNEGGVITLEDIKTKKIAASANWNNRVFTIYSNDIDDLMGD